MTRCLGVEKFRGFVRHGSSILRSASGPCKTFVFLHHPFALPTGTALRPTAAPLPFSKDDIGTCLGPETSSVSFAPHPPVSPVHIRYPSPTASAHPFENQARGFASAFAPAGFSGSDLDPELRSAPGIAHQQPSPHVFFDDRLRHVKPNSRPLIRPLGGKVRVE